MNLIIEKLNEEHLQIVDAFSCIEKEDDLINYKANQRKRIIKHSKEMDIFLKEEALKEQNKGLNMTHLFVNEDNRELVGYVSLCNDNIKLELDESANLDVRYTTVPAMKIARLAVSNLYQHQGIGKQLISFSVYIAKEITKISGVAFVTLDCYEHRLTYYQQIGFVRNNIQPIQLEYDSPISMRLSLNQYLANID